MKTTSANAPHAAWIAVENGYDRANSPAIIQQVLSGLKTKRIFINISHKGYQSNNTILVSFNDQHLKIDKPVDWPGKSSLIRVDFKDESKLSNYFKVKVVSANKDTLVTTLPTEIYRLQQRQNYRVDVPRGSLVSFEHKGEKHDGLTIQNVSAGGILFCSKQPMDLKKGGTLDGIRMIIPSASGGGVILKIRHGEIVRSFHDRDLGIYCFGVALKPKPLEEDALEKYVRQREIEILGKGMT